MRLRTSLLRRLRNKSLSPGSAGTDLFLESKPSELSSVFRGPFGLKRRLGTANTWHK